MVEPIEYFGSSGPLLIADVPAAALWKGGDDDGSGVVVRYMASGMLALPPELLQTDQQGMHEKKFRTCDEAREFESALLAAMKKLHPEAKPWPGNPDVPGYSICYVGEDRVWSIEETFRSAYDKACKALKGGASVLTIDKQQKARGVFMDQEAGIGLIFADANAAELRVVLLHVADAYPASKAKVVTAARELRPPAAKAKLKVDGRLVLYHSAFSASDIAKSNWGQVSFLDGANKQFEQSAFAPLELPDQQQPGGAFVRLPPGTYNLFYDANVDVGGLGATMLWLAR